MGFVYICIFVYYLFSSSFISSFCGRATPRDPNTPLPEWPSHQPLNSAKARTISYSPPTIRHCTCQCGWISASLCTTSHSWLSDQNWQKILVCALIVKMNIRFTRMRAITVACVPAGTTVLIDCYGREIIFSAECSHYLSRSVILISLSGLTCFCNVFYSFWFECIVHLPIL